MLKSSCGAGTLLTAILLLVGRGAEAAGPAAIYSYPDLVRRMVDLEAVARLPEPGERCALWSSRDRASRYDESHGRYVNWDANSDADGCLADSDGVRLLGKMNGPGCIWRIWSATPEDGPLRIIVDGRTIIDLPFRACFSGRSFPFDFHSLSYSLTEHGSRGNDLYYPIPYRQSCRIETAPAWPYFYQITYSTFPPQTAVPDFAQAQDSQGRAALARLNRYLRDDLGTDPAGQRAGAETESGEAVLAAGRSVVLANPSGAGAITAIRMGFTETGPALQDLLQRVALVITWDREKSPAVWCPLGDFFGATPGAGSFRSLLTGMDEEGAYALWYMPYAEGARVELSNEDSVEHRVTFSLEHAPLTEPAGRFGRFHCKWHRDLGGVPRDRRPDWPLLRVRGRGRVCGFVLHVWHGDGEWWGEGDEKFFVDGELMPSSFGTGTEDYFGYAWGDSNLFAMPFHGQTYSEGPGGHHALYRWQVADNVPFQRSFEGFLEKYQPDDVTLYAATACFYLEAGGVDPIAPTPLDRRGAFCGRPPVPGLVMLPARPDPSPGEVSIDYSLSEPTPVTIRAFDAGGRLVAWLSQGTREAGDHTCRWPGTDREGRPVPSGLYFLRIEAGGRIFGARASIVR